MRNPQRREDDEGVAVGVAGAEVIQVDAVGAREQRQLVLERLVGRNCALSPLKASIFSMFALVFSCATISTDAGKNSLLPV